MSAIPLGLYEEVLLDTRQRLLESPHLRSKISPLDPSHYRLADAIRRILAASLDAVDADGGDKVVRQIHLCNEVLELLRQRGLGIAAPAMTIAAPGRQLLATWLADTPNVPRPDTPLSTAYLLTGTRLDPSLESQLRKEFASADRVDILCSFIKWTGTRLLKEPLEAFALRPGTSLRVITTSYMGVSDAKAIDYLAGLANCQIRVSYDTHRTRLHAKAYMFHRATGFGSAYVGSANISRAAMTDGLEWTVKVSQYETQHLWQKIDATFETYWNDTEFELFTHEKLASLQAAIAHERGTDGSRENPFIFDLQPHPFQKEILERLEAERELLQRNRHLIVAATGTGKTMIAAFDYRAQARKAEQAGHERPKLLFVAHRQEILEQARTSFRAVLRDHNFGQLLVGGTQPSDSSYLFASIQSIQSRALIDKVGAAYYQYVVVDEVHHGAAASYRPLLAQVQPQTLLGLTATPERQDGEDVFADFGHHVSAEIRLPDAINQKLLCPFHYFAVSDCINLDDVQWRAGGYDALELEDRYVIGTSAKTRVGLVVDQLRDKLADVMQVRGLGFCAGVEHARYMAKQFSDAGIPSVALDANSSDEHRQTVQARLRRREVNFIFVVDLYNEGVDIREIDTVLFLRPTESLTVFLQQLGRGLRLCEGKDCLTVLDFVGRAHKNFDFGLRFRALLGKQCASIDREIESGLPHVPAGCSIVLERQAREYIIENIRAAIRNSRDTLKREVSALADSLGRRPTFGEFLETYQLDVEDVYRRHLSWSRLCADARSEWNFRSPHELILTKGLRRVSHIDSPSQIKFLSGVLSRQQLPDLNEESSRRLVMLWYSLFGEHLPASHEEAWNQLELNAEIKAELLQLFDFRFSCTRHVAPVLSVPFVCPLTLHAQYTRDEVLAALGVCTLDNRPQMREGVRYLPEIQTDIFLVTLDKAEADFSPTTMYEDYAISETLFHWQSQSTTPEDSATGERYRSHPGTILLFAREKRKSSSTSLAAPYAFLGPAEYVSHEGSRPMSIIWRLCHPCPSPSLPGHAERERNQGPNCSPNNNRNRLLLCRRSMQYNTRTGNCLSRSLKTEYACRPYGTPLTTPCVSQIENSSMHPFAPFCTVSHQNTSFLP